MSGGKEIREGSLVSFWRGVSDHKNLSSFGIIGRITADEVQYFTSVRGKVKLDRESFAQNLEWGWVRVEVF